MSWPLCSPIFGLHSSNRSRLWSRQWFAPPAWKQYFVYLTPWCSWVDRHGRITSSKKEGGFTQQGWWVRWDGPVWPCKWEWGCLYRLIVHLWQPAAGTPFFTHTHAHTEPGLFWTLNDFSYLVFQGWTCFFLYPNITTASTGRTVKQSLPFPIFNVECVTLPSAACCYTTTSPACLLLRVGHICPLARQSHVN